MGFWLLKTEPSEFSYSDLEREKRTVWDGVTNNTALMHIRAMQKGDRALVYHRLSVMPVHLRLCGRSFLPWQIE